MINIDEMKDYIYYCAENLYSKFDFSHVDNNYWIGGGFDDECCSYCYECCLKEINKINKKLLEHEEKAIIDGGWGGAGCNGGHEDSNRCEICGKALDYSLSESGVMNEVEYFLEYEIENIIDNENAFELYQIFEDSGYYTMDDEDIREIYKLALLVANIIGITIKNRFEIMDI